MPPSSVPKHSKTTTRTLIMKAVGSYAIRYPFVWLVYQNIQIFFLCIFLIWTAISAVCEISLKFPPLMRQICLPKFFHGIAKSVRNLLYYTWEACCSGYGTCPACRQTPCLLRRNFKNFGISAASFKVSILRLTLLHAEKATNIKANRRLWTLDWHLHVVGKYSVGISNLLMVFLGDLAKDALRKFRSLIYDDQFDGLMYSPVI
jgi:hypothetical protein